MPLGPRVLLTKSPTAMAPTKAARRAFSPFSSVVPSSNIWVGLKEACKTQDLVSNGHSAWIRAGGQRCAMLTILTT